MKANKGEWFEFYAFLKILDERKLFAADKNLEIIPDKFFVFRRVFRMEAGADEKIFDIRNEGEILILDKEGNILKKLESETLPTKVVSIFNKIKSSSKTTFQIEEASSLMNELLCTRIKAGNYTKSDIEAEVFDRITDTVAPLGFSVKSAIGGASTLLNSSGATNFIFEVEGLDEGTIQSINEISTKSKIRDRILKIKENGGKFKFKSVSGREFESNLKTIDTSFHVFLANMLLDFFSGKGNDVKKLTESLSSNKELEERCGLTLLQYEYKVKEFLQSVALGMVPSRIWDGGAKAHGGYIVVRDDGIVICYHLYNRDEFLSYLFENTKFDSPSSGRHNYGTLYKQEGKTFFNLNLQIRFK